MKTVLSPEWLALYEEKKEDLRAPTDFNNYFSATEICNRKLFHLNIGDLAFLTGQVIVHDPLIYLQNDAQAYFTSIPPGKYPLSVLVMEVEEDHYRSVVFV